MLHEHAARALVELVQIGKTSSGADPVLHHAPESFDGIEVVAAARGQAVQPKLLMPVGQRRRELVGTADVAGAKHVSGPITGANLDFTRQMVVSL
jgi:hypothetical protein